ncbi:hypothetical protein WDU94_004285 [Cyamophila willieti]
MFSNIVQRLQTLSPLTSPVTSPVMSRKKFSKSPAHRRSLKEEFREVQSDPEDCGFGGISDSGNVKPRSKRKIDKIKSRRNGVDMQEIGLPILHTSKSMVSLELPRQVQGSKSVGRIDGYKQVNNFALNTDYDVWESF